MKTLELQKINLARLRHAEMGQLVERWIQDAQKVGVDPTKDADLNRLYTAIQNILPTYNRALDQVRGQEESEKIADLDHERDQCMIALRTVVRAYQNSKNEAEYTAYKRLDILLKSYKGVETDSYESETIRLKNLVESLKSNDYKADTELLGLSKFVSVLEQNNTTFNEVFSMRSHKILAKESFDVKALRKELTQAYSTLTRYVEVMVLVKQPNDYYVKILESLNNGRKYFSDMMRNPTTKPEQPTPPAL